MQQLAHQKFSIQSLIDSNKKSDRYRRRWNKKEDDFLKSHYQSISDEDIAKMLGRTKDGVRRRRFKIFNIWKIEECHYWTHEDDYLLRELYGKVDNDFLAAFLFRSTNAIWNRAFLIGINIRKKWSHEEDEILRHHYPNMPAKNFAHLIPGRSIRNIYHRAHSLFLARGLPYMHNVRSARFHAYPSNLQNLIRLYNKVERKLQDVEAQH